MASSHTTHRTRRLRRAIAGATLAGAAVIGTVAAGPPAAHAGTITVTPSPNRAGWWVYSGFSSGPNCGQFVRDHFPAGREYYCTRVGYGYPNPTSWGPWQVTVPYRVD